MSDGPLVSVITPTFDRPDFHPWLYRWFDEQTHEPRELLVLDDGPEPSPFFSSLEDDRVRYFHTPDRYTLGGKRGFLAARARGDVIAHFDDDDHYAPRYLERMLEHLEGHDLVKLSGWFVFSHPHRAFAYWDTADAAPVHFRVEGGKELAPLRLSDFPEEKQREWIERSLFGYGNSLVYRRRVVEEVGFDDIHHREDYTFVRKAEARFRVRLVGDTDPILLATHHARNHSALFPQYRLPPFLVGPLFGDDVVDYLERTGG